MSHSIHIYFVTGNPNKQAEIKQIFQELSANYPGYEWNLDFIQISKDIPEIQHSDVSVVTEQKVKDVANYIHLDIESFNLADTGYIAVDDTGYYAMESPALGIKYKHGYPGSAIKGWLKSINTDKQTVQSATCRMFGQSKVIVSVAIGLFNLNNSSVISIVESDEGVCPSSPKNGSEIPFGWDPCFVPNYIGADENADRLSYDQLTTKQKNSCSMRKQAIDTTMKYIINLHESSS